LQYLRDIEFDGGPRKTYKYGLSIIGDEEIPDYGGGICGSSTALYQGILTNLALDITQRRSHTRRYSDLYPATIN
jgi:vancomycin resistance protein YoaR